MAKKDLSSLMSGILGEPAQEEKKPIITDAAEVTPEMESSLEEKRKRNVGRPRKDSTGKGSADVHATFIVNPELIRKMKYVSLVEGKLLKEVIGAALTDYLANWEANNGKIRLPKKS